MNGMRDRWTMAQGPEAGNTLVVALLILFLLTSVGISYVAMTKGEKQIVGNQLAASQAFANAEAGISEALVRMSNPNDGTDYIGQPIGVDGRQRHRIGIVRLGLHGLGEPLAEQRKRLLGGGEIT